MCHHLRSACWILAGSLLLPAVVSAQAKSPKQTPRVVAPPAVDAVREKIVTALNAGDGNALFALLDEEMRKVLPKDKAQPFAAGVRQARGKITAAKPIKAGSRNAVYLLTAERGQWSLSIDLDEEGRVAGLLITDPPAAPPSVATSDIPIGLPFKGRWFVFWGGDTLKLNHHVESQTQRRAADLIIVGDDGKSYRTDGKANEDYLAFGRP